MSEQTKECKQCKVTKPLSEMVRRHSRGTYDSRCIECNRKRCREFYKNNRKIYVTRDKIHTEKTRARNSLKNAVRLGKIKKQPCEICGETKVDAHHEDYSKQFAVKWLCRKHHSELHRLSKTMHQVPQDKNL